MSVLSFGLPASVTVANTRIQQSQRAGLSNFGSAVSLSRTEIVCAGFELEGEPYDGMSFAFTDAGANSCGCPDANATCISVSASLEAPAPETPSG